MARKILKTEDFNDGIALEDYVRVEQEYGPPPLPDAPLVQRAHYSRLLIAAKLIREMSAVRRV